MKELVLLLFAFLPVTVLAVYYGVPVNIRELLVLAVSIVFFACHGLSAFLCITGIILFSYCMGRGLEKYPKKQLLIPSLVLIFSLLFVMKYLNDWADLGLVVPIGLSYYSLMAAGYLIEVCRGNEPAEQNLLHYAVFLMFFLQASAGPIGRSRQLLCQWREGISFDGNKVRTGFIMLLMGLVEKFVLADNLAKITNGIFGGEITEEGLVLVAGILIYAVRIYFDFAGYSLIAIGGAKMLGITLMENFHAPYHATSIKEFWRRWHISLSSWFKDYLYIPLGGSRVSSLRIDLNLLLVFLVSGLWHGTAAGFLIWGALHGLYQIVGRHTLSFRENLRKRLHMTGKISERGRRFLVFILVAVAFLPFQVTEPAKLFSVLPRLFVWNPSVFVDGTFLSYGVSIVTIVCCAIFTGIYFAVDSYHEKRNFYEKMAETSLPQRLGWYLLLFTVLLLLGVYGSEYNAANFIYGQF